MRPYEIRGIPIKVYFLVFPKHLASIDRSDDPMIRVEGYEYPWHSDQRESKDPFAMRDRFIRLESPEDAVPFFEQYGPYEDSCTRVAWSEVIRMQEELDRLRLSDLSNWQPSDLGTSAPPLMMDLMDTPPCFRLGFDGVRSALRGTVFLEKLQGVLASRCAKCNGTFSHTSNHTRKYCSDRCAHLAQVHKGREKARIEKLRRQEELITTA